MLHHTFNFFQKIPSRTKSQHGLLLKKAGVSLNIGIKISYFVKKQSTNLVNENV
ncbi:hypothetical protein FHS68_000348 [Dyadobacter arcticus]|uniref:Uncharacterized protein n=1 Tax=Dyadobacter arcticus TaxID=1078754 RepID=A0ABX0UE45_9BACT|nr:hypothetical protein [Dyadobacter arcticus]